MAKYWYYQRGYGQEPKRPVWTGPARKPNKARVETHQFDLTGKTLKQLAKEVESFKQEHGISTEPKFKSSWGRDYLEAKYTESQDSLEKRQTEWQTQREAFNAAVEKYKPLKKKWDDKIAAAAAAREAMYSNEDNFVVVKLTPAQYKKLMANT